MSATLENPEKIVSARYPGRWVAAVLVLIAAALFAKSLFLNKNLAWPVVEHYIFARAIMGGVLVTIELTLICMSIGILLGIVIGAMRLSSNPVLAAISGLYVWFFRGVPLLVQLIFWYNLALLFPHFGVPFTDFTTSTNNVIDGFTAAILGIGLSEVGYMAEIIRAGILAIDRGQEEAAITLGMTRIQALRRIVLPQATRVIIPPTGNRLISVLKNTSLVAFIAGGDLLTVAGNIYSRNFQVIALLIVATIWYLFLVSVASIFQRYIERRFHDHGPEDTSSFSPLWRRFVKSVWRYVRITGEIT